jgi:predicted N-formylglutamate amidohydrolase
MTAANHSFDAVKTLGLSGPAPVLFLCEHAAAVFPEALGDLRIDETVRQSHVAWDPGALALATRLAERFAAPLVHGAVSRLLYDCNRPPEAPDAIPARSEVFDIPGNVGLSGEECDARCDAIYRPFCAAVDAAMTEAEPQALVTIHSFTPIYHGKPRAVEIGVLYDADSRLAEALLAQDWDGHDVRGNEPYGPADGVTHSLKLHAISRGILNVMIEVRNDLIATPEGVGEISDLLARNLTRALADSGVALEEAN